MLPEINVIPTKDNIITEFKGLNQTEKCTEEEFSDMQNMYSEEYPFISPRKCRVLREYTNQPNNHYGDIVYGDDYYSVHEVTIDNVSGYYLFKNFEMVEIGSSFAKLKDDNSRRQIVKYGAYLFIYPDNILYNPQDNTLEELNYNIELINDTTLFNEFYLSDKNGVPFICDHNLETIIVPTGSDNMKTVDANVSNYISNSTLWANKILGLSNKTVTYQDGTAGSLYFANIMISRKEYVSTKGGRTSYPLYFLDLNSDDKLTISKYNNSQKAFLPADVYLTLRIPISLNDNIKSKVKVGDYINFKCTKSNGEEPDQDYFEGYEERYDFIQKIKSVRVENLFYNSYYTYIVISGITDAYLEMLRNISSKIKFHYYADIESSSEATGYFKVISDLDSFLNFGRGNSIINKTFLSKKIPDMDYITVSANRIWGCSSDNHEIYACKQGDASCWYNYAGLASDSYAVTIASEEKFTGAITLNETPYFFKENMAYALYGNKPKNYQVQQIKCRGVEDGAYLSICQKDGYAYYKSTEGIERFNGNNSQSLTEMLNMEQLYGRNAAISSDKVFIFLEDEDNKYSLYVYDIKRGLWHIEDKDVNNLHSIVNIDGNAYMFKTTEGETASFIIEKLTDKAKEKNNVLIEPLGKDVPSWYVESGEFNAGSLYNKYITKFMFEMKIEEDSNVKIYFSYNDTDKWERVFKSTDRHTKRTIKVPIVPKRCERMKYKIEGVGQAKIYTILMTIEGGSEEDGTETY